MTTPSLRTPATAQPWIRARVTLVGTSPKIWRVFDVDPNLYLDEFHLVLQTVMGWEDCHLHSFANHDPRGNGRKPRAELRWAPPFVREEDDDGWYRPEENVTVGKVLTQADTPLFYEYDFGDSWTHRIDWEGTTPVTNPAAPARVIRGKRRCPLEDSGGIWGYQQLIVAVSDPTHEEHHDFAGWAHSSAARSGDDTFDPDHFDPARTNEQLTTLSRTHRLGKV